jgi:N-acetylmuramoyl-L-alanine amidase
MRTVNTLLILTVLLALHGIENSFGEIYYEYEVFADSDFSHPHDICIDPGHGGSQSGNLGRVYGLLEKDVNLSVVLA